MNQASFTRMKIDNMNQSTTCIMYEMKLLCNESTICIMYMYSHEPPDDLFHFFEAKTIFPRRNKITLVKVRNI